MLEDHVRPSPSDAFKPESKYLQGQPKTTRLALSRDFLQTRRCRKNMISVQRWLISVRIVPQNLLRVSQIQNKSHNDTLEPSRRAFLMRTPRSIVVKVLRQMTFAAEDNGS